jgi:adenylosuccinate synthase
VNLVVLGAQWGDEGKGKIVDLLAPRFSIVARYAGGHNAGHTVYVRGSKFILRLIPSGILHPDVTCVIGNGVVVDPQALLAEVDELARHGVDVGNRLVLSDRAHLILPYHRELDVLSEARRGERKIGTTSRGIGPAYEDKVARRGVRVGDLAQMETLAEAIRHNVDARNKLVPGKAMDVADVMSELAGAWERMRRWVKDVSVFLATAHRDGRTILFEGAQGTLLDIDHGTYPYVTSSSATAGGACIGLGVGPRVVGGVLGVAKAYTTRVGEGPLPTELHGEAGERLRQKGGEFGAVTGRPRRCGWFDAVAVRYAARINGLDALAITKLDVLDGMDAIPLATAYRCHGRTIEEFPADLAQLAACEPVYETMPGWSQPTKGVRSFDRLPVEARNYVARLEQITGVPAALISTGSDREETIFRMDSVAATWFA